MKLLTKSTYYFFLFSIVVMMAGGALLFLIIRKDVYKQIDTSLITEKNIIQDQIEQTDSIPDFSATFGHQIEVRTLESPTRQLQFIRDTVIKDESSDEYLPYRYIFYSGNTHEMKLNYHMSMTP